MIESRPTERTAPSVPLLSLAHISKTFDGVFVLKDVSFELRSGEVHALLGQNGSGKSTLIKILAGYHAPEPGGTLTVRGNRADLPLQAGDPARLGIAFVHQDLGLVESMSVVDNLAVGRYRHGRMWRIDWSAERRRARELLIEFGVHSGVGQDVGAVPNQAERALLAIARAVATIRDHHESGVLVLDEPTVYLPRTDVDRLRDVIRLLATRGVGVIYVTHRIDELSGFADRVTVLRDGMKIDTVKAADFSTRQIVTMILGREAQERTGQPVGRGRETEALLSIEDLSGQFVRQASFSVSAGEILGVTGLAGMGQEELVYLVYGAVKPRAGQIILRGRTLSHPHPRQSRALGMVLVPSDRGRRAGLMNEAVFMNMSLPVLQRKYFVGNRLNTKRELADMTRLMKEFQVTPLSPMQLLGRFSGGNQQKAILAKWLQLNPPLVLLDEPTQGVDVGTKKDVLDRIARTAADGAGVIISSVEYEDLASVCDRVIVFRNGMIAAELSKAALSKESIAAQCYSD